MLEGLAQTTGLCFQQYKQINFISTNESINATQTLRLKQQGGVSENGKNRTPSRAAIFSACCAPAVAPPWTDEH
ncbi:hypothetical protein F2P44_29420 [Massilia sp. CCM 8695]|uniref:Uncharacterized protein n=1 Tax=Massilia frigida TaxID=2609281 RepID=A0ABX0NJG2_9BURK|nr:hypothetical protein [Massilia frigida]NHZ83363.1 hypothetical protein [Massilia frigida]